MGTSKDGHITPFSRRLWRRAVFAKPLYYLTLTLWQESNLQMRCPCKILIFTHIPYIDITLVFIHELAGRARQLDFVAQLVRFLHRNHRAVCSISTRGAIVSFLAIACSWLGQKVVYNLLREISTKKTLHLLVLSNKMPKSLIWLDHTAQLSFLGLWVNDPYWTSTGHSLELIGRKKISKCLGFRNFLVARTLVG